jgi:integrase
MITGMSGVPAKTKKPRADRGDGSVKEILTGRHKGKWRVRLTYRDKWNRTQDVDKIVGTQREGKDLLKQVKKDAEAERIGNEADYKLGTWYDWLKENDWKETVKSNTVSNRAYRFEKYSRPLLGDMRLSMIRPMIVRSFYTELKAGGIGVDSLQAVKNDLVNIVNKAIAYEVLDAANPFSVIKVESPKLRKGVVLTPTGARIAMLRLYVAVQRNEFELWALMMFVLALCTGLRRGELLALTVPQFDLSSGLLTVDKAVVVLEKGRQEVGLPKKDKIRTVVLAPILCNWLQAYIDATKATRGDSDLLFPSSTGKPLMVYRERKAWSLAKALAKLPAQMILHDCRLTHNTWIEKLMPSVSESTRLEHMGHAAQGVNRRNYTRELTPAMDDLQKQLQALFTEGST